MIFVAAVSVLLREAVLADDIYQGFYNASSEIAIYVSSEGDDTRSGFSPLQHADAPDGPVKSAHAALRKIRFIRSLRKLDTTPARIVLMPGRHMFTEPLVLNPQDSNLIIEGNPVSKTIAYGGRFITGWQREEEGGFWFAPIQDVKDGKWDFRQLYVNGEIRSRARLPGKELFTHESRFEQKWNYTSGGGFIPAPTIQQRSTMVYAPGQIPDGISLKNAEFIIYHQWDVSWAKVISHDPMTRTLRLNPPCTYPPGAFGIQQYAVENVREGMLRPGQWYLDRDEGKVVYWPLEGEDPNVLSFEASVLESLVQVNGSKEKKVSDITIRNLYLQLTSSKINQSGGFGAPGFEGAISMNNAVNCGMTALTISRTGGQGIKITNSSGVAVKDCEVHHTGANGIYFHNGYKNLIENNSVHDVGLIDPNAMGINAGYQKNTSIAHNDVYSVSYSGIALGNSMKDNAPAMNTLEYNRVWDVMNGIDDGACIYLSGKEKKSIVKGNVLSDSRGRSAAAAGLYLDENVEDVLCEDNLVYDISGSPLHVHMARNNTIRNNIFVCNAKNRISFAGSDKTVFEHNIVYAPHADISFINPEGASIKDNLIHFSKKAMESGKEEKKALPNGATGTIEDDPGFVDSSTNNFNLRPDSPALKAGFKPFDSSKAGRATAR
ncbi:MAG TPA: right-handed parallel beta-helix repeat-containing protein [Syntrophales bacterium]|nr:right-handed parallel beta-helix repeat-containing protein [Syntrophales bacterium]